ncbi:MAG: DNA primase [Nanoarchaeota archaeon]|nr:DNA primase [Nanoarchaeota archaeon]MBU1103266.1 DNA primase [Nanoarchaeota archaeon]
MAKISPVSIKYMIYASFKTAGPLEKPDVIGAIFGQTEGLLGSDMEMRELQKEGKIGRIEVELESVDGKSIGEIKVPTAMDKSATTLIAAALETIDKIGPTEAEIKIEKIEDVRSNKRDFILERAKKLMGQIEEEGSFKEMSESLKVESRTEKIQEYGESRLPCGDISGDEIIVAEGRADVLNLLRNRVNNVIGMDGTKLPKEIAELGKTKELTLFVDGDRGGKLIANNIIQNARVKYVAVAPEGKEVEELTGKEILIALRRKVESADYVGGRMPNGREVEEVEKTNVEFSGDVKEKLRENYGKVSGTRGALLLDSGLDVIRKVGGREIARSVKGSRTKVAAIVFDGAATANLINLCDEQGISYLAATNFASVSGARVELIGL